MQYDGFKSEDYGYDKLLPCPFCGNENDFFFLDDAYDDRLSVCCPQCSMTGPDAVGKQTAVILWNHRH